MPPQFQEIPASYKIWYFPTSTPLLAPSHPALATSCYVSKSSCPRYRVPSSDYPQSTGLTQTQAQQHTAAPPGHNTPTPWPQHIQHPISNVVPIRPRAGLGTLIHTVDLAISPCSWVMCIETMREYFHVTIDASLPWRLTLGDRNYPPPWNYPRFFSQPEILLECEGSEGWETCYLPAYKPQISALINAIVD